MLPWDVGSAYGEIPVWEDLCKDVEVLSNASHAFPLRGSHGHQGQHMPAFAEQAEYVCQLPFELLANLLLTSFLPSTTLFGEISHVAVMPVGNVRHTPQSSNARTLETPTSQVPTVRGLTKIALFLISSRY